MFCEASTGIFIVRRCRRTATNPCEGCGKSFCDVHFNQEVNLCLACAGNTTADSSNLASDPSKSGYRSNRSRWSDYYYTDYADDYNDYSDSSFTSEDYQAFNEIQTFDKDDSLDRSYDS